LPEQDPIARRHSAQLLVAPRADRTLTIGDTHVDDTPGAFGSDEDADRYLISRATEVLVEPPAIRRRWTGSYLRRTDGGDPVLLPGIGPGTSALTAAGGRGMTAAPALARQAIGLLGLG